ncbi:MAG TPA: YfhO family protein, partial [Clostridiales bacterium]|nr:YfhO family protein [Clostridiales bacterium]
ALYSRPKVLIPLLPILCLIVADFLTDLLEYRYRKKAVAAFILFIIMVLVVSNWNYRIAFMADSVITILIILASVKFKKGWLIYIPVVLNCALCCVCINMKDTLFLLSDRKLETDYGVKNLVQEVSQTDGEFHRFSNEIYPLETVNKVYSTDYYQTTLYSSVYNKDYNTFYYDIFNNEINFRNSVITNSTKSPLFNIYMGNKYIITNQDPPIGYDLVKTNGDTSVYKNDNAFPLGYVTDKIMCESDFDKLEYPYTSEALMEYCVVDRDCDNDFSADIKEVSTEFTLSDYDNIEFEENNGIYSVKADEFANMTLTLDKVVKDKILFIRFNMDYQHENEDAYIIINDVKNKLTCKTAGYPNENYTFDYLLSSNEPIEKLNILFKKGDYQISNIRMYTLYYSNIKDIRSTLDPFEVDMGKTSGDNIYGKINATRNGIFVLNIPYDKGFSIKVDGENIAYEKVNKAFIGFEIEKGEHNIDISYQSPLQKEGIALTVFGFTLAIGLALFERRKVVS